MARNGSEQRSPRKDEAAGELIRRLRCHKGLSRQDLAREIEDHGVAAGFDRSRVHVSDDTLYLIEVKGREPGERIKFAISLYFGLRPGQIWKRDALGQALIEMLETAA